MIAGNVVIEQVILVCKQKSGTDGIQSLQVTYSIPTNLPFIIDGYQIHLFKLPNRSMSEASSGRISPRFTDDNEVSFYIPEEYRETFQLRFRTDRSPEADQYEVQLHLKKKGNSKLAGTFGVCFNDLEIDSYNQRMKIRQLDSPRKNIVQIEIKYKVCDFSRLSAYQVLQAPILASAPPQAPNYGLPLYPPTTPAVPISPAYPPPESPVTPVELRQVTKYPDNPFGADLQVTNPTFKPKSCIVVVGTTGRGKTTTMNLYTGNTAETASLTATGGITGHNQIYQDQLHPNYPVWLDTVGLDHSDARTNNSDLIKSYLLTLQAAKVRWVHSVIWCITPEGKVENDSDYFFVATEYISEDQKPDGAGGGDQDAVRGGESSDLGECHHHRQAGKQILRAIQLPGRRIHSIVTSYYGETFQLRTILLEWSSSCRNALTFFWWEFAYFFYELVTRMEIASLYISSGLDSNLFVANCRELWPP